MKTNKVRMAVDAAMTMLLPCLMAYSLIGETFHEVTGVAMFALFIAHHILNRAWRKALFRGRYSPYRAFVTAVDLLLCVVMVCLPLYMTLRSQFVFFDYAEPRVWFFADYFSIMVLFATVGVQEFIGSFPACDASQAELDWQAGLERLVQALYPAFCLGNACRFQFYAELLAGIGKLRIGILF